MKNNLQDDTQRRDDIRKVDVAPLKGVNYQDVNAEPAEEISLEDMSFADRLDYMIRNYGAEATLQSFQGPAVEDLTSELLQQGLGDSRRDLKLKDEAQLLGGLQNFRANQQRAVSKLANGLSKGAILAGTTFLSGTVGLGVGVMEKVAPDGKEKKGVLWDNEFTRTLKDITDKSEEILPNFYSNREQERPWYKNIFTANFIGDKFIKNLGFTVGAFYSGNLLTKALKIPQIAGLLTKSIGATKATTSLIGGTLSAINEGRIEALNNSQEWLDLEKMKLEDSFTQRLQELKLLYGDSDEYFTQAKLLEEKHNETLSNLSVDAAKMGNMVLMMNIPILIASNVFQFGKLYSKGFDTARRVGKVVKTNVAKQAAKGAITEGAKRATQYVAKGSTAGAVAKGMGNALSEGMEEFSQAVASLTAGDYYNNNVEDFYKAKQDPEFNDASTKWLKSFAWAINDAVNDGSIWEEFFIGALTGALGMPVFGRANTQNAYLGRDKAVGLSGGMWGEILDYNKNRADTETVVNYLNKRLEDPLFKTYYQAFVANRVWEKKKEEAAETNDKFNFKNAEHAQMITDIMAFAKVGRLQDLIEMIEVAYDTSDENLEAIIDLTTQYDEDGSIIGGPFVSPNGKRDIDTQESKDEMVKSIKKAKETVIKAVEDYDNTIKKIDSFTDLILSEEQVEELAWLFLQQKNWEDRTVQMMDESKDLFKEVLEGIEQYKKEKVDWDETYEKKKQKKQLTEKDEKLNKTIKLSDMVVDFLRELIGQPNKNILASLKHDTVALNALKDFVKLIGDDLSIDKKQQIGEFIKDVTLINEAYDRYEKQLKEYLKSPEKITEKHRKMDETLSKKAANKFKQNLRKSLLEAKSLEGIEKILTTEDNLQHPDQVEEVLSELSKDDTSPEEIKTYKQMRDYFREVSEEIDNTEGFDEEAKADAKTLFQNQKDNAESLETLAYPEGLKINDEKTFVQEGVEDPEDLAGRRFQNARFLLQSTMHTVNNRQKFKGMFSDAHRKPPQAIPTKKGVDSSKTETGNDATGVTPTVGKKTKDGVKKEPEEYSGPVGVVTYDEMVDANDNLNDRPTKKQDGMSFTPFNEAKKKEGLDFDANDNLNNRPTKKQDGMLFYYSPAIPQFDISQDKRAVFTPFNEAKKKEGLDFDAIYNHIKDSGAFDYINKGKLHVGDRISFMIDPSFNDHTIFMVVKNENDEYQIVGSLPESAYKVKQYVGLHNLQKNIKTASKEAVEKGEHTEGRFYYDKQTVNVAQILTGKLQFGEERSLADIPGVLIRDDKGKVIEQPKLAVMVNGLLEGHGIKYSDIEGMHGIDFSKQGRLYMLVKTAAGRYTPVVVRVKHFNKEEFDVSTASKPDAQSAFGKELHQAIWGIAEAFYYSDENAVREKIGELGRLLYIKNILFNFTTQKEDKTKVISLDITNKDNVESVNKETGEIKYKTERIYRSKYSADRTVEGTPRDIVDLFNRIYSTLESYNLPLQVSSKLINTTNYNTRLINAGILTSNLQQVTTLNSYFITDYFSETGEERKAIKFEDVKPAVKEAVKDKTFTDNKDSVHFVSKGSGKHYHINYKEKTIRNEEGKNITNLFKEEIQELLFTLARLQEQFGGVTHAPEKGLYDGLYWDGKSKNVAVDIVNQRYLSDTDARNFILLRQAELRGNRKHETGDYTKPWEEAKEEVEPQRSGEKPIFKKYNQEFFEGKTVVRDTLPPKDSFKGAKEMIYVGEDGKTLHIGKAKPIEGLTGIDEELYYTLVEGKTKGKYDYNVIFPNGISVNLITDGDVDSSNQIVLANLNRIKKALNGNPARTRELLKKETLLTFKEIPQETPKSETYEKAKKGNDLLNSLKGKTKKKPRMATTTEYKLWDRVKELKWLEKVLPQLTEQQRVKIIEGLIKVGDKGSTAWGMWQKGMITLSDVAAEGTVYHEAFHVVFDLLLDDQEREALLAEAREKFGKDKTTAELEEDLAEDFRMFVASQQTRNLGQKIVDFFKDLFDFVSNWGKIQPNTLSIYKAIHQGRYAKDTLTSDETFYSQQQSFKREIKLTDEVKLQLEEKDITEDVWEILSERERENLIKCIAF